MAPPFYVPLDPDPGRSRGFQPGNGHYGIDYNAWTHSEVFASADGWVIRVADEPGGYGLLVELGHADGWVTRYGHLERWLVQAGQDVRAGDLIAYSDNTGGSTGPHLHFETRVGGSAVDPDLVLVPGRPHDQRPPPPPPPPPTIPEDHAMLVYQTLDTPPGAHSAWLWYGNAVVAITNELVQSLPADPVCAYAQVPYSVHEAIVAATSSSAAVELVGVLEPELAADTD